MDHKHRSFRVEAPFPIDGKNKKWWQFRKMGREEYRKTAINYTLIGLIFSTLISNTIFGVFTLIGLLCGSIWLVWTIFDKSQAGNSTNQSGDFHSADKMSRVKFFTDKLHAKKVRLGVVLFITIMLLALLYFRPILSKRYCDSFALSKSIIKPHQTNLENPNSRYRDLIPPSLETRYDESQYEFEYIRCLRRLGI